MSCKASTGSMLRGLFQPAGGCQIVNAQALCKDLLECLGTATLCSPLSAQAATVQVRASLQSVIRVLEASTASGKSNWSPRGSEVNQLVTSLLDADLPARMVAAMVHLDFEARKDVMRLFGALLRLGTQPVVEYVRGHPQFLQMLLDGCGNEEVALNSNMMLRSCAHNPKLVGTMLEAGFAMGLLKLTGHENFSISSDAFASLREVLLTHKAISAEYLAKRSTEFFEKFNALLQRDDYVTKRQGLRLLGEILLDRSFMKVMLAYVGNEQYLQIHMNLLRENSKALQVDAFHIFKIFAANPKKPQRVQQILYKNRERLIKLIGTLKPNKGEDASFTDDQAAVVKSLMSLEAPPMKKSLGAGKAADGEPGVWVSAAA
mmetsp:Transcript_62612/g.118490  ORF Transcript_62612/g.118490 Transcript_62612/m.118490 type:complete len:375 (-) Transcript_62612:73-1197(-)